MAAMSLPPFHNAERVAFPGKFDGVKLSTARAARKDFVNGFTFDESVSATFPRISAGANQT
jgi:hypothetical protein